MNRVIEKLEESQLRKDLPALRPGDTVRVHVRLKESEGEKEKERIQPYEGVVIALRGRLASRSVTIRRVSFGIGVERIFPINSPSIQSIEVVRSGKVRRAKLYYLRERSGKSVRLKERFPSGIATDQAKAAKAERRAVRAAAKKAKADSKAAAAAESAVE